VRPALVYRLLRLRLGRRRDWWPGATPLLVAASAILVQGVRWQAVARVMAGWQNETLWALWRMPPEDVARRLAALRFPRQKAARLIRLLDFVATELDGDLGRLAEEPDARARLLALPGIGPETADAILAYALRRPTFVADAYAARIFARLGRPYPSLAALKAAVEAEVPAEAWAEFHALLVDLGREFCRARPRCRTCPIADACPRQGLAERAG
jgi:endonuclease-3 related protein